MFIIPQVNNPAAISKTMYRFFNDQEINLGIIMIFFLASPSFSDKIGRGPAGVYNLSIILTYQHGSMTQHLFHHFFYTTAGHHLISKIGITDFLCFTPATWSFVILCHWAMIMTQKPYLHPNAFTISLHIFTHHDKCSRWCSILFFEMCSACSFRSASISYTFFLVGTQ